MNLYFCCFTTIAATQRLIADVTIVRKISHYASTEKSLEPRKQAVDAESEREPFVAEVAASFNASTAYLNFFAIFSKTYDDRNDRIRRRNHLLSSP